MFERRLQRRWLLTSAAWIVRITGQDCPSQSLGLLPFGIRIELAAGIRRRWDEGDHVFTWDLGPRAELQEVPHVPSYSTTLPQRQFEVVRVSAGDERRRRRVGVATHRPLARPTSFPSVHDISVNRQARARIAILARRTALLTNVGAGPSTTVGRWQTDASAQVDGSSLGETQRPSARCLGRPVHDLRDMESMGFGKTHGPVVASHHQEHVSLPGGWAPQLDSM